MDGAKEIDGRLVVTCGDNLRGGQIRAELTLLPYRLVGRIGCLHPLFSSAANVPKSLI